MSNERIGRERLGDDTPTLEFERIEIPESARVRYELSKGVGIRLPEDFRGEVEIQVGQTSESSVMLLRRGLDHPELCRAEGVSPGMAYMLVQPDVMREERARGWHAFWGPTSIGRLDSPRLRLGSDVSRREHAKVIAPADSGWIEIIRLSSNPVQVVVDSSNRLPPDLPSFVLCGGIFRPTRVWAPMGAG